MKLTRIVVRSLLILILAGCMSEKRKRAEFFAQEETVLDPRRNKKIQPPPFTRAEAEDAICEAVIVRFAREASARSKSEAEAIFVGLTPANADPNPGYLKRFEKLKTPVLPISAAARLGDGRWIDKVNGKRGVALRVERIDWEDFYTVRVPCVWSVGSGNEQAAFYQLYWKKDRWMVR
jgi:hypothetical protein